MAAGGGIAEATGTVAVATKCCQAICTGAVGAVLCRTAIHEHHRLLRHAPEVLNVMLSIMADAAPVGADQHLSQSPRTLALLARQELQAEF